MRNFPTHVHLPPRCSCLREIRAAVAHEKPFILVHESDPTKGGAPFKELEDMFRPTCGTPSSPSQS